MGQALCIARFPSLQVLVHYDDLVGTRLLVPKVAE